jgi:hypothetical protein
MRYRRSEDSGMVLAVVLLVMLVFTVMMLGFYLVTTGEQKIAASDRDSTVAYYGAIGALEKMSSDLAALFVTYVSPSPSQITGLTGSTYVPSIPGVTFAAGSYSICQPPSCPMGATLASTPGTINGNGPLQGLQGIITPFVLTVIAAGPNNTEVKMTRQVQEVAVPVFQYGIFSDSDLSFFAEPNFGFGGRVHTNGNLFLAQYSGATLTLSDRVTAFKDVIRTQMANGFSTASPWNGTVNMITTAGGCNPAPTGCRSLGASEGSVVGGPGSAVNVGPPSWSSLSLITYTGLIRNGATGAKKLNLALALAGASPIVMIQRPITVPPGPFENPTGLIGHDRFFNQASLRILISDTVASIMNLPGIDSTVQPFPLDEALIHGAPYSIPAADACHPPVARSPGYQADHDYMSPPNTTLVGGYIKIEEQLNATPGTFKDVTAEILKLGISKDVGTTCVNPDGNGTAKNSAIIHLQELRTVSPPALPTAGSTTATDYTPINLYDPREGESRDTDTFTTVSLNGVLDLAEVDVKNLREWFAGNLPTAGSSGPAALNSSGYILYFSDRRGNCNQAGTSPCSGNETGEFGNEDIINPSSSTGALNGTLDPPEDVDGDSVFRTYGATPHPIAVDSSTTPSLSPWPAFIANIAPNNPIFTRVTAAQGQKNSVVIFRRALRLVNGTLGNLPPLASANCTSTTAGGFTVAAENPVYVFGDYNASVANGFNDTAVSPTAGLCHVPSAVIADAVTLLSNGWTDAETFNQPTSEFSRPQALNTWYRTAISGGKNVDFTTGGSPTWDFGLDGGVHNFLRYIEYWGFGSPSTLNYRGSLVSFYYSRQATGIYKCCNTVYWPPTRAYAFDTDFQTIGKLPPGTPRFTDVNVLSYQQAILSTQ